MRKKLLLVDCYDSFTFNLLHLIEKVTDETPQVIRVDACTERHIDEASGVIFSPGPGLPAETFDLLHLVRYASERLPVLGVCLGHQAISQAFGAELKQLSHVYHGIARKGIITEQVPMFENMANSYDAASYHSWTIDAASLPHDFVVSSLDEHAEILSIRHKTLSVWGVQFHPESVLCPQGYQLIKNWFESEILKKHMFD